MMQIVCGVCGNENGYSKSAISVSVKSGAIRIRTHLCLDCMAQAEDARVDNCGWDPRVTIHTDATTDPRSTNT